VPKNKRGLPNNFQVRYTSNYIEELSNEKILSRVMDIETSKIKPDAEQPRKLFNKDSLKELASSIKEKGVLEPILVYKNNGQYTIISGERRWKASILAGKKTVPVIELKPSDKREIREIQIIENLQREDITPIERAKVINEYLSPFAEGKKIKTLLINYRMKRNTPKKFAHTVSALCKMTGKNPITFVRWLSLLELPEDLQRKVDSPNSPITSRHIEHLLKLEDFQTMRRVAQLIEKEKLSSEETKNIITGIEKKSKRDPLYIVFKKIESLSKKKLNKWDKKEKTKIKKDLTQLKKLIEELLEKLEG
jgi:ParB family chromosome partitioning protein